MNFVFSTQLVQAILAGAQASPQSARSGLIHGADFGRGQVRWLHASQLDAALRDTPDALATLVTHPDRPPIPEPGEFALPRPRTGLLLIASLNTRGVLEMRAFDESTPAESGLPITLF